MRSPRPSPTRPRKRAAPIALGLLAAALLLGGWAAKAAYDRVGRTPGELMDYAERRLYGHTRLESVALPALGMARDWLGEPSRAERLRTPFVVPPPPPLDQARAATGAADALAAWSPGQRVLSVGPAGRFITVADAARAARDGDIIEIASGTYRGDVALFLQKRLTIRGVNGRARFVADGRSAEGKAIWVFRHGDIDIANVEFVGARVDDRNGAGIRFEGGTLRIADSLFWGNENGILAHDGVASVEIRDCEFGYNGSGDGLSHGIYIGRARRLAVSGSYFHHGNVGHLLKSRAASSDIRASRFTDESGGRSSYELDFPDGGVVVLVGNIVQQNRDTQNSAMVAYGEEGRPHAENRLAVASNTLANDHPWGGAFLRVAAAPVPVLLADNLLVGAGVVQVPFDHASLQNPRVGWEAFVQAARQDYRPVAADPALAYQPAPSSMGADDSIVPTLEYFHPAQSRRIPVPPASAGALQALR